MNKVKKISRALEKYEKEYKHNVSHHIDYLKESLEHYVRQEYSELETERRFLQDLSAIFNKETDPVSRRMLFILIEDINKDV